MRIKSSFVTRMLSGIIRHLIKTKLGRNIAVELREVSITPASDGYQIHLDVSSWISKSELDKLFRDWMDKTSE